MGKSNEKKKAVAGKHSCVVNGPESGDSDIVDSDDSMNKPRKRKNEGEKRNNFEEIRAKKTRRSRSFERGVQETEQEGLNFKMVLRFSEEKGVSSMSLPILRKLTTILRNQIGDTHLANVLRDGNLLIVEMKSRGRGLAE